MRDESSSSDFELDEANLRTKIPTESFRHDRLDNTKQEIRLCHILPSQNCAVDDVLECKITHHILGVTTDTTYRALPLQYKALSYCWGRANDLEIIMINDKSFTIRRNLAKFLKCIRNKQEESQTLFWVDQLCVDQSSVEERNHQVGMMSCIYSQASAVFSWLGTGTRNTEVAFQFLRELEDNEVLRQHCTGRPFSQEFGRILSLKTAHEVRCLLEVLSHRYWSRVWIVQEVFLAHDLHLLSGVHQQRISGDSSWTFACCEGLEYAFTEDVMKSFGLTSKLDMNMWLTARDAARLMSNMHIRGEGLGVQVDNWMRVDHAIISSSPRCCSEPKDFIFGVQACLSPENRIVIDYDKSAADVFLDFLKGGHRLSFNEMYGLARSMKLDKITSVECRELVRHQKKYRGQKFLYAVWWMGSGSLRSDNKVVS